MKKYNVINDFIDKDTGDLIKAGNTFAADDERAEQLKEKQLIGKEAEKQPTKPKGSSSPKPEEQVSQPTADQQPDKQPDGEQ